mmetsp:Transcript_12561/g.19339  ORF Transcript_12561/g.19339 Transcript_12561/m.19339 type:complete len:86 (-) Transcript_12561:368-625(-)|eukprot:CAMPEP_0178897506 /NCGR_PEP_ID=MMETSP0786-20121207/1790_1 /TAXON_ID=186022 /ORGANISM="Thalassionema frauenfeldii, Strain CCMP 1798" /LENGTH=85 /DNA_ID=CAMNT_0020568075 /DNA_START=113 /DNA_END=370 /DNA_ORIENTATION=+
MTTGNTNEISDLYSKAAELQANKSTGVTSSIGDRYQTFANQNKATNEIGDRYSKLAAMQREAKACTTSISERYDQAALLQKQKGI